MSQPIENALENALENSYLYKQSTILRGQDGNKWVAKFNVENNTMEWHEFAKVELNGYRALTVEYIRENIGKEICIFERESKYGKWPSPIDSNLYKLFWTPNGDAMSMVDGIIMRNWLITQNPPILDDTIFLVLGFGNGGDSNGDIEMFEMALQVNSKDKKSVSSSVQRLDAFVYVGS